MGALAELALSLAAGTAAIGGAFVIGTALLQGLYALASGVLGRVSGRKGRRRRLPTACGGGRTR